MEEIIKIEHLKKYFKGVKAVDDISFCVEKGELFGFLGVNGAGKSTTINMLCTLYLPTDGNAKINGLTLGSDNEEIKRHIGVVYQNNCLDNLLTVKENLLLRGGLYVTDSKKLKGNLNYVCSALELEDVLNRKYGKLSGGQIGSVFDIVTLAVGEIYICANGGQLLSLIAHAQIIIFIVINCTLYAIIMYIIAMAAKTSGAWSGIGTVIGTLVGFVGAIYLPVGSLPASVANFLKYLPVLHGTSILRKICCSDILSKTFSGMQTGFISEYNDQMGITVAINGHTLSSAFQIGLLLLYATISLIIAILITIKKGNNATLRLLF